MNARERINAIRPSPPVSFATALVVIVGMAVFLMRGGVLTPGSGSGGKAFFTVDDGKFYFVDGANRIPPFKTAEGKTAYRAHVCLARHPYTARRPVLVPNRGREDHDVAPCPGHKPTHAYVGGKGLSDGDSMIGRGMAGLRRIQWRNTRLPYTPVRE